MIESAERVGMADVQFLADSDEAGDYLAGNDRAGDVMLVKGFAWRADRKGA